jgi:hypothetical protein
VELRGRLHQTSTHLNLCVRMTRRRSISLVTYAAYEALKSLAVHYQLSKRQLKTPEHDIVKSDT